ncbi:small ribosomal subunit biogenesis GTPase RsgA [Agarilytica rhodophyticola]|uniref:small ribosomal subunit biogenesis GTPase RsgA n=1 Tax=Agarilytica rhodophyticola TaxID=1737490 RepID=UPI000B345814|nr:small ribosomal subunit biogenesis GTPase RsgA [Agarilytica rhodophyticola]
MSKRRLSQTQARRIKQKQQKQRENANKGDNPPLGLDEDSLGIEQHGRVVAHYGTQVDIEAHNADPDNGRKGTIRCFLRANLGSIVTGDHVIWRASKKDDLGVVVSCQPRQSLLSRPDTFGKLKPVAANVSQIIITIAPKPEAHTNLIDRYLVIAEINDIAPIIIINKADLISEQNRANFSAITKLYTNLGYRVLSMSAHSHQDIAQLTALIKGKTSIFVGQSGVGKSSIIQRLVPEQEILVGSLSEATAKGRHTTTHSQLFHFAQGGECIDSPGIREFGLWHLHSEDVIKGFVELREIAQMCKFRDCLHEVEPGCAIRQALEDQTITQQRFDSYKRIIASLNDVAMKTMNNLD